MLQFKFQDRRLFFLTVVFDTGCQFAHQVLGVAQRFYADVDELVVLHLDRAKLTDDLVIEPAAEGVDEHFPHLYRPIPLDAVTAATTWRRDGTWHQPDGL